jgi:tryptophan-rich sensory protein
MELLALVGIAVACGAAAATGALFPPGSWYEGLVKPSWTPPNWLFPVAWTVLYVLIGWATWRISGSGHPLAGTAMAVFAAQMTLNGLWSPAFFGLRRPGLAFSVLVGLWVSVAVMIAVYVAVDLWAGLMMVPYLLWVTVAGALNLAVWRRNPAGAWGTAPA